MIGDQLDRDIELAHDAGLMTVLVPGRFQPNWIRGCETSHADISVTDFLTAIKWILQESVRSH
jgi:ribonucleotide monophosphatase NagD (HAD superfamily)